MAPTPQYQGLGLVVCRLRLFHGADLQHRTGRRADAPKTWADLLNPKWRGQLSTSPITIGGTAWMQYAFMRDVLGADYLKKFAAQEPKQFPPTIPQCWPWRAASSWSA